MQYLDFYAEILGTIREIQEDIVRFLHKKFKVHVNIVIACKAKSAVTLIIIGGNSISITETGSTRYLMVAVFKIYSKESSFFK